MPTRAEFLQHIFRQLAQEAAHAIAAGEVERPLNLRCDIAETDSGFWALDTHLRFVPHDLCRHVAMPRIET
jgi:hypothetical protein